MGPAGWPRLGEGRGETGGGGGRGGQAFLPCPWGWWFGGEKAANHPRERTAEENSLGEVSRGVTLGVTGCSRLH